MLWASFPPLALWPLAWVALIPWLLLVRQKRFGFRRPYLALYAVGFLTWLAMVQWIRLPHWSAFFGWLALSAYLAIYIPLFVGLARVAVHALSVPVWLAAPVTWCGLEAMRTWMFTGFAMMLLGHSQAPWRYVIQISDIGGPHAVSFLIVMVTALLLGAAKRNASRTALGMNGLWRGPLAACVLLALATLYGTVRVRQATTENSDAADAASVALIQGSVDTTFSPNDDPERTFAQYIELSRQVASRSGRRPDLLVWPESMFTGSLPHYTSDESFVKPPDVAMTDAEFERAVQGSKAAFRQKAKWVAGELGVPMLVGAESVHWGQTEALRYNTALWIDNSGQLTGRYDKMHPVMFGEYVPLGELFPILYKLTPMPGGLTPGTGPQIVRAGDVNLSPCICFENVVPHLIRRQIRQLESQGTRVDGLVTITNDGWFWGSSLLDVHLTCGVFRAVENRRLMLIAANTGFSAHIDETGKVVEKGPRRDTAVVLANVQPKKHITSFYTATGDWLGLCCGLICLPLLVVGWRGRRPDTRCHFLHQ